MIEQCSEAHLSISLNIARMLSKRFRKADGADRLAYGRAGVI